MTDFDLVPTAELLSAIFSRFDTAAFVGCQEKLPPDVFRYVKRWKGNNYTVVGLCAEVQRAVLSQCYDSRLGTFHPLPEPPSNA